MLKVTQNGTTKRNQKIIRALGDDEPGEYELPRLFPAMKCPACDLPYLSASRPSRGRLIGMQVPSAVCHLMSKWIMNVLGGFWIIWMWAAGPIPAEFDQPVRWLIGGSSHRGLTKGFLNELFRQVGLIVVRRYRCHVSKDFWFALLGKSEWKPKTDENPSTVECS